MTRTLIRLGKFFGLAIAGIVLILFGMIVYANLDKRAVFREVKGQYKTHEVVRRSTEENVTIERVELINDRNQTISTAYVRRPESLEDDYKILMTYAGQKTGRKILELLPNPSRWIVVAVQYPYDKPEGWIDYLLAPYTIRQSAFKTVGAGMLAVDYVRRDLNLDTDRVTLIGASLGSIFATIHGAIDERIPRVVIVHGGGDFETLIRNSRRFRERNWPIEPSVLVAEAVFDTFDPIHYVDEISPRPFVLLGSKRDEYFPVESVRSLYKHAMEPKQLIWTDSGHISNDNRDLVNRLVDEIKQYLRSKNPVEFE